MRFLNVMVLAANFVFSNQHLSSEIKEKLDRVWHFGVNDEAKTKKLTDSYVQSLITDLIPNVSYNNKQRKNGIQCLTTLSVSNRNCLQEVSFIFQTILIKEIILIIFYNVLCSRVHKYVCCFWIKKIYIYILFNGSLINKLENYSNRNTLTNCLIRSVYTRDISLISKGENQRSPYFLSLTLLFVERQQNRYTLIL